MTASLILHQISEFQAYEYRDAHRLKINRNFIAIERKKTTFRAVEDGLSYNEEVADGEKSCWAPWPPRCRRLVRISRSIPDWCRRIHQKRIHTTQTEDRRPALSFVRDHNLYAAHSPQWWLQIKRSNDWRSYLRARLLVGRFFFESLTSSSRAFDHSGHGPQSMLFSFSVTWALDYFAYIHIRTLWQCSIVKIYKNHRSLSRTALTATSTFSMCEQLLKSEAV